MNAVIAEKIRNLYINYLSGMSLVKAAEAAGIKASHTAVKRILRNRHYPGDSFYPAIIDRETFEKADAEITRRSKLLGRDKLSGKEQTSLPAPTRFHMAPASGKFEEPKQQAEYLYSLIESEVN